MVRARLGLPGVERRREEALVVELVVHVHARRAWARKRGAVVPAHHAHALGLHRALSSTSATGSISTSDPDASPRPGNALSTVTTRAAASQAPPRYPITSFVHRCACVSMTSCAAGRTTTRKGCAPGSPLPGRVFAAERAQRVQLRACLRLRPGTRRRRRRFSRRFRVWGAPWRTPWLRSSPSPWLQSRRPRRSLQGPRRAQPVSPPWRCAPSRRRASRRRARGGGGGGFRLGRLRGGHLRCLLGRQNATRGAGHGRTGTHWNAAVRGVDQVEAFTGGAPSGAAPPVASVDSLKPYCFAAAEFGSRGLPDSVYPSPVSATFFGRGLPCRQSLMKCFCAWLVNARWSRVPTRAAHARQSGGRAARAPRGKAPPPPPSTGAPSGAQIRRPCGGGGHSP